MIHPDIAAILASQRPLAETYGKAASVHTKASVGADSTEAMAIIPTPQNERERLP